MKHENRPDIIRMLNTSLAATRKISIKHLDTVTYHRKGEQVYILVTNAVHCFASFARQGTEGIFLRGTLIPMNFFELDTCEQAEALYGRLTA